MMPRCGREPRKPCSFGDGDSTVCGTTDTKKLRVTSVENQLQKGISNGVLSTTVCRQGGGGL